MASATYATFIADFPEFSNGVTFPASVVNMWLGVSAIMLNANNWGALLQVGQELFTAHHVTLATQNQNDVNFGGLPGQNKGPVDSKTVKDVSVSYNSEAGIELDAGHWNLTTYGTQFIRLARMFGAGGAQVSGSCPPGPTIYPFIGFPYFS